MRYIHKGLILGVAALTLTACSDEQDKDAVTVQDSETTQVDHIPETFMKQEQQTLRGRIEYKTFEGGFYAFIAEDGSQWTLQGLPQEHKLHGLTLTITGTPMPDVMTTTQFGTVMRVDTVTDVDSTTVKTKPASPADS
ncbi:hypothetical protein QTP81_11360 [Alteromonas sp. ASW11-36]|uniref:Uncharacterized protein n=1 Tax=Alteromonas arenosi TaxID=3055817 RepID=A0ABT7SYF4_9ALTE|nr:hypothetical protein [Alteromonas sp. ASW11-36]MDM7861195.1 hypothetical protein [Alteromonas sp. ASW11-36]